jgi:muconolactone delta-isomerase
VEFLVDMEITWPADADPAELKRLHAAEAIRAEELAAAGLLCRLWRVPGRCANTGLWRARDADELHAALVSLPFYPWLDIRVRALAGHPSDPDGAAQTSAGSEALWS